MLAVALGSCDQVAPPPAATVSFCASDFTPAGPTRTCPVTSLLPLQMLEVTVTGQPGVRFSRIIIQVSGLLDAADTAAGSSAVAFIPVPAAVGEITVAVRVEAGGTAADLPPVTLPVVDVTPPGVLTVAVTPDDSLAPGDSITLDVAAVDNGAVTRLVVTGVGALPFADTLADPSRAPSLRYRLRIPPDAGYGQTVQFRVQATDAAGLLSPVGTSFPIPLRDYVAPGVYGFNTGTTAEPLVPGDTMRITVWSSDNHRVAWAGYRLGRPAVVAQDSVAVARATDTTVIAVAIPGAWVGRHSLTVFVHDSSGNIAEYYGNAASIVDAVRRPVRLTDGAGEVTKLLYDRRRDVLYVQSWDRVTPLDLATMTLAAPYHVPNPGYAPRPVALSPSGDSLLYVTSTAPAPDPYVPVIGAFDATGGGRGDTLVPLVNAGTLFSIDDMAVIGGRVFLAASTGGVLEYTLASGAHAYRPDGAADGQARFAMAPGGGVLGMFWETPCCTPAKGRVYSAAADAFGAAASLPASGLAREYIAMSTDSSGGHYLFDNVLVGPALDYERTFAIPSNPDFPASLSRGFLDPDGLTAWFAQVVPGSQPSVARALRVRLADGAIVAAVLVPDMPRAMFPTPDRRRLVGLNATGIFVVDLP